MIVRAARERGGRSAEVPDPETSKVPAFECYDRTS
jgi:hypothetical protein